MTLEKVKLGAVAKVLNGYAFKSKEYVDHGIRVIRITNVQKGRIQDDDPKFIDIHRSDEFARFMLADGDILISLTGNVGRVGVIEKSLLPAALNQRVGALKIESENVDPEYLFHVLNSDNFEQDAIKNSKGIAQLNLSSKWVEKYEIPLPPLAEQRRIAGILDAADSLRAKRREALAQLDTLLQSTFLDMFGDPVTNPFGWDVRSMKQTRSKVQIGPFGSLLHKGDYVVGGVPLVNPMHIVASRIQISEGQTVSEQKAETLAGYRLAAGDVIMGRRGEMGRCAIVSSAEAGMLCGTGSLYFRSDPNELLSLFFAAMLSSQPMKRHLEGLSQGVTMANLNRAMMEKMRIPLPPLDLQRRFATIVESVERQKARMRAHLAELDALFASLHSRAFSGTL